MAPSRARRQSERTGLHELVRDEPVSAVESALALAGHRVRGLNPERQSLLFFAVQRAEHAVEVCQLLLSQYRLQADLEDFRGQTAYHWLATTKNTDCVDVLAEAKCDVNHVDRLLCQTPLFYAAHRSGARMVRRLLAVTADANIIDTYGKPSICWASGVDSCKELAALRATSCAIPLDKKVIGDTLEVHKQHNRLAVAKYFAACAEAWFFPRQMSWCVKDENPEDASGIFSGYVTSLATQKDVRTLCLLENEFIADHRMLLEHLPDAEFWNQVGVNPDAAVRNATIRSIALTTAGGNHARGSGARPQCGPVRHYTLVCRYMRENRKGISGSARARSFQAVGYVYFKVVDGTRNDDSEDENSDSGAETLEPDPTQFHIVISHIKVGREHQRRGLACLLLAGALRVAAGVKEGLECRSLCLSVAEKNCAAVGLYRKLGFVVAKKPCQFDGWVSMRREINDGSLSALSSLYVAMSWKSGDADAGVSRKSGIAVVPNIVKSEGIVFSCLESCADSNEPGLPPRKRRREFSSSSSSVSDVSTSAGSSISSFSSWDSLAS
eukprot:TRINITY_DN69350_c0_g1_i1.p1 TRINITY_DN69350_c0_g1~~TRINITY_DN69350_c0_g1_i1.p1  ORF type:complete len:580 (-),score=80.48 TRINITY_DN69350_c0_g1_i1:204-1865(-)